ncbi:nuclear transport factor 2 family protein [Actinocorallia longicatena]|uniref:Nuclear transport factor 2 family protein n=1 Tax=Actinocorallia longicatena TaxID=111803 RepID=A0ABP6QJJ4_9ACTN
MEPRELSDRLEIAELLARYALAVDTGDWELFSTLFTEDATLDYASAGGVTGTTAEARAWLSATLAGWPARQHLIASTVIRIDGDEAEVRASFTDTLAPSGAMLKHDAPGFVKGGGWYHHRLIRTDGGWRSRGVVLEQIWRTIQ